MKECEFGVTDFHLKYDLRSVDICILIGACAIRFDASMMQIEIIHTEISS